MEMFLHLLPQLNEGPVLHMRQGFKCLLQRYIANVKGRGENPRLCDFRIGVLDFHGLQEGSVPL